MSELPSYEMVHKPYKHQLDRFLSHRDAEVDALFWEQGLGKTKGAIDKAAWLRITQKINGLIVITTNGVHFNWIKDELPEHMPPSVSWVGHGWSSQVASTKKHNDAWRRVLEAPRTLAVLAIPYDAVARTDRGKAAVIEMLRRRKCMIVIDESARIKTPNAGRTKTILPLGRKALYRMIMTGTPVANSPFDIYSQFRFLDPDFWKNVLGISTFTEFKTLFGEFETQHLNGGERTYEQFVSYRNLNQLQEIIKSYSSRVTKDVLDLPPKVYQVRYFEMVPKQRKIYEQIRDEALAMVYPDDMAQADLLNAAEYEAIMESTSVDDLEDMVKSVTAPLAIVQLLRMQQVLCGYVKTDDGVITDICADDNPRMNVLFEEIETALDAGEKIIIWSRFRRDIDKIMLRLHNRASAVRYDGSCNDEEKEYARKAFQKGDVQVFVANPSAAGEGLTLTAATVVIYYTNSFKLTERLQSEDRAHRIGQKKTVQYIDVTCADTTDEKVIRSLRKKMDIAGLVTGDRFKEWLI